MDSKISQLTAGTPLDTDIIPYVDLVTGVTKKAPKSSLKGDSGTNGTNGTDGVSAYVYIAYASDASGTGFTLTFNASLDYIAIKSTTVAISSPSVSDFTGLWKNYKGVTGSNGTNGTDGKGIVSITLISTVGKVKTYRILFTDATTFDYIVTDGADGTGSGDMIKATYDPLNLSKALQPALTCVGKTANYTANPFELVNCDVSAASFKVTLPSSPADGTIIYVKLNGIGVNKYLTIATSGTDKFNTPTGTVEIYMYLFGEYAQCQYCSSTGIWTTFISAATYNFATNFPGVDATTPISNTDISINTTSRVLTITPPLGYFNIFTDGGGVITRYRKVGTINFPAFTDTSGMWYFYFDSAGVATASQSMWSDFTTVAAVYRIVWNKDLFKFTVTAATATLGDTYTNNSSTFTVTQTIAGGTTLICERTVGTNNPSASGNLVRTAGAGTNPIVFSAWDASAKLVAQYIEYHQNTVSASTHLALHLDGSRWSAGFDKATNELGTGTPDTDGRNTVIALSTGSVLDDNLTYTVTNNTTGNPFTQDLGNITPASLNATNSALFKIFTQNAAGEVSFLPATRFPFAWNVASNRPEVISQIGSRTVVTDNRWFVYFIYSTQNPVAGEAIKIVSAPTEFTSLSNAQAYTWSNIQSLYPIIGTDNEIRPITRIIFYNDNSGGGSFPAGCKYSVIRETQDIRKGSVTSTTAATGSLPASSVTVVPAGNIASTNVQSALEELDTEKLALAGGTLTGALVARINPRLVTAASYTTDTGTSLSVATCDQFEVTAQAGALKFNNPGGTPVGGNKLVIRIKDNGTARALTYDTQFRAMGNALPTTTVLSKTLYMGFIYNATDTKWDLIAVSQEA
ncbi:MAG: hypothetical protein WCN88_04830 [Candidatus Falkowbacteria bacterium]